MTLCISRSLLGRIVSLAAAEKDEICGLLLGGAGRISAIRTAANVAADPAIHFEIDPAVLIAAHREARAGGPAVIGHYHSHPSGYPVPSATDVASAVPDGSYWMIVAAGEARLWRAEPGEAGGVRFAVATLDIM